MVKATWEPEEKLPSETQYGAHMDIGQYGDLNTLRWVENEFDPAPNMLHCEVTYGVPPSLSPMSQHPMDSSKQCADLWHHCYSFFEPFPS